MTEYRNSLMVVKFDNNKVPVFVEPKKNSRVKWVKYGDNNDYPNFLVTLFNRSAKHNAICTSKQLYIKGQGFTFNQEAMEGDMAASMQAYIDAPNPYESLTDVMDKTALDELLFGGFYLKGVNNKKGELAELYHIDYTKVRSNEDNTEFYYSDYWFNEDGSEKTNLKDDEYKTIPAYDPNKKQKEFIYYYKSYRPNIKTYTLPEYIGAVPAIITDAEIANFHRAEIQNGFKGSRMIIFKNGVPSDEEMKSVERRMKAKFSPTDAAGSMVIDFVDDPNRTPEVIPLNGDDFDKRYDALNRTIQEEIFVGHKVTSPMLFGVRVEGQLGGRNEMVDSYNLFQNTYIGPKQKIQEYVFDMFAPIKGRLEIKPLEPIMPSFSEQTLIQILTKDEMREVIGRKPQEQPILEPTVAEAPQGLCSHKFSKKFDDKKDLEVFMKYGEPIQNFASLGFTRNVFSKQDFALNKLEQGILDIIKKTPDVKTEDLVKILKTDKTKIEKALERLTADKLVSSKNDIWGVTEKGGKTEVPTFEDLFIRYKYALRPDAPALIGESREFCESMMANPRYFSREDIENISKDLGNIYNIPDYDAFRMRGGWYHDPVKNVNLPFCRHIWVSELVKRVR